VPEGIGIRTLVRGAGKALSLRREAPETPLSRIIVNIVNIKKAHRDEKPDGHVHKASGLTHGEFVCFGSKSCSMTDST
jgi:hypothetical protein